MSDLEKYKKDLTKAEAELDGYWKQATSPKSEAGTAFSENEKRTIAEYRIRIDRIKTEIEKQEKEEEGTDGSTKYKAISYSATKNKTWKWKLVDVDFVYDDFGASLEINFSFGKEERGTKAYWILDSVLASPQSTKGLKLEVNSIRTKYYELKGNLAMMIDFQFKLSTADVSVSTSGGVGGELSADTKKSIGVALPVEGVKAEASQEQGVKAGFTANYQWAQSQVLPGSAATISRRFLCINKDGNLTISLDYKNDVEPSAIDDPGMDPWGSGAAEWKITVDDSGFTGNL
jgi:hypothetical protein